MGTTGKGCMGCLSVAAAIVGSEAFAADAAGYRAALAPLLTGHFRFGGGHAEKGPELWVPRRVAYPAPHCLTRSALVKRRKPSPGGYRSY